MAPIVFSIQYHRCRHRNGHWNSLSIGHCVHLPSYWLWESFTWRNFFLLCLFSPLLIIFNNDIRFRCSSSSSRNKPCYNLQLLDTLIPIEIMQSLWPMLFNICALISSLGFWGNCEIVQSKDKSHKGVRHRWITFNNLCCDIVLSEMNSNCAIDLALHIYKMHLLCLLFCFVHFTQKLHRFMRMSTLEKIKNKLSFAVTRPKFFDILKKNINQSKSSIKNLRRK